MLSLSESQGASERPGVWFSTALSTRLPEHEHGVTELNLLVAGSVRYRSASGSFDVERGQLLVLPAHVRHELVETSDDAALWVLEWNPRSTPTWMQQQLVVSPPASWAQSAIALIRKLWTRPGAEQVRTLTAEFEQLLERFEPGPQILPEPLHPSVAKARSICEQELTGPLEMDTLARRSGISSSRLAHLFQAQLGLSPLQYKNFSRLQHFIRSRRDEEPTLLRAALESGFGSYAQFHRIYHQVCGVAPGTHLAWLADNEVDAGRTMRGGASR